MAQQQYEIRDENDEVFVRSGAVAAAAHMCGVTPTRQAEFDADTLNVECGQPVYRAVRAS